TTSTSGTMLISARAACEPPKRRLPFDPPFPTEKAIRVGCSFPEVTFRHIQEFERKIFHPRADLFDHVAEVVICHRGGNGSSQPERGREQRLGDSRRYRPHARRSCDA